MRDNVWDIKKGNVIYECEYGGSFEGIALEDAHPYGEGFMCKVEEKNTGRIVEFFGSPEHSAYAPDIMIKR